MEKKNIGGLFDSIAGVYDRFNHLLSLNMDRRWRRKAVSSLRKVESLLDVAAGTGDLSLEIAWQGRASSITGMDISAKMMEIGRAKVAKAGLSDRISFVDADAMGMPFRDGAFDAVTCAYGVRNFPDLDRGLSEMFRVLADGGQLMILEFSYPDNPVIRWIYDLFFSHVMPLVGKAISDNPGAFIYFRDSVKGFIWGEEMVSHLEAAGFIDVKYRTMTFGITTLYIASKS